MIDDSRIGVYKYVESILANVTENVYLMSEPQDLTQSDVEDGFVVVRVGDFLDASEFSLEAYGMARVYIDAYVPPMSRGRLNVALYTEFEDAINEAVQTATEDTSNQTYWIQEDSMLSMDLNADSNANNAFYMFIKSFIVVIGEKQPEDSEGND